jgi:hypothetical protein
MTSNHTGLDQCEPIILFLHLAQGYQDLIGFEAEPAAYVDETMLPFGSILLWVLPTPKTQFLPW